MNVSILRETFMLEKWEMAAWGIFYVNVVSWDFSCCCKNNNNNNNNITVCQKPKN